jgi:hypothetical protein
VNKSLPLSAQRTLFNQSMRCRKRIAMLHKADIATDIAGIALVSPEQ